MIRTINMPGPATRASIKWFISDREGAVAPMFAAVASIALIMPGIALDIGRFNTERFRVQMAADAAAIAGARAFALDVGDPVQVATDTFKANASTSNVTPVVTRTSDGVSVTANVQLDTTFLKFAQINELSTRVESAASTVFEEVAGGAAPGGDVCILLMDGFKHHSLLLNGSMYLSAPSCEVQVKSTRQNEAMMVNTNVHFDVAKTCVEGKVRRNGGNRGVVGPIEENCRTIADPFVGKLPVPTIGTCKQRPNFNGSTANLTPGTYCGSWNFNGNVKDIVLSPGVYVLNNSVWTFNGRLRGEGVTIYYATASSRLQLNGQGSISIQAPTSGTYAGIVMYESGAITQKTQITVNGGSNSVWRGLVYLPSRDMTWNGNSGVESDELTVVFNSLILNGNTTWRVKPFEQRGIKSVGNGNGANTTRVVKSVKLSP
ncbi:MAG: TadE/TadG family type IV pilus assembly protein [Hyphomicrobiaceae bacterium]